MAKEDTGAADQELDTGVDQNQNDTGTDQGTDTGTQDGKPTPYESQKRRAELAETDRDTYKQQLIDAGILGSDGKPKTEQKPAPKQQASGSASNDDVTRARLEARGVLDEDAQDAVLEAAKVLGILPIKALDNEIVKGRVAKILADKATKDATPAPSRGGGNTTNIGRLADKALETGELPTDPKLKAEVKAEMRKRSK